MQFGQEPIVLLPAFAYGVSAGAAELPAPQHRAPQARRDWQQSGQVRTEREHGNNVMVFEEGGLGCRGGVVTGSKAGR